MPRRMEDDLPWPDEALSLLDTLWALNTPMYLIRQKLTPSLGHNPSPEQVRAAATRLQEKPERAIVRGPRPPDIPELTDINPFVLPERPTGNNPVRLVPPGTFPNRGFTMLRARR